ncbi:hypothetical protein SAMN04487898_12461 [Pedobacter sp. ok626]|uniref:carboxypeptidase-like regulatory domain-containing protein n=1 Tax=Pedobacter sp. ok626 TaxID=1761882 RepID=UPI000886F5CC|nr:carboxypeptidase-like regulatory domain-containing protein [Pedobacter sp. ok626]SDL76613.1 hypothetical protein SAMN04487898_12461 [Pedobacter sp. ok626]
MKRFILIIFLACIAKYAVGQQLKVGGLVKGAKGAIESANLQLKNADQEVLSFSATNAQGAYSIEADVTGNKTLYLIASYIGVKRDTLKIDIANQQRELIVNHNFTLADDALQLEEINIKSKPSIATSANDTTKYNVARLTSAEDRNLESVIKKMPGMKVTNDGTIYFNQQRINKVLLEGDDMTGENYKTITQHLKPNLVEEVQAIEHYVENDLLNGIISSDEVVLNLKIKDKKSISGSVDAAYGTANRKDLSTNLISFYNGIKAFSFLNHNNVGKYQADLLNLSNINVAQPSNKLLNHTIEDANPFDGDYFRLNNSFSGSISLVNRINKDLKITLGVYAIKNKLFDERYRFQQYYLPETILTEDRESRNSNNKNYQVEWSADQRINEKSHVFATVAYTIKDEDYQANSASSFNLNPADVVLQRQADQFHNLRTALKYIFKANPSTAFVAVANVSSEKVEQAYDSESDLYGRISDFENARHLLQKVYTRVNTVSLDLQGLKKTGNHYFYFNLGASLSKSNLNTELYKIDGQLKSQLGGQFVNQNQTEGRDLYFGHKYTFDNRIIKLQFMLEAHLRKAHIYNQDSLFFYLQPRVNLKAKLNENQDLIFDYRLKNNIPDPLSYYENYVFTDVRNVNQGLNQFRAFFLHRAALTYLNNSFSANYMAFRAVADASYSRLGWINTNFFDNEIYFSQMSLYKGIKRLGGEMVLQKFIPVLAIDATVELTAAQHQYYAALGEQINPFANLNHGVKLKLGTGFKLPVNLYAQFHYLKEAIYQKEEKITSNEAYKYAIAAKTKLGRQVTHVLAYDRYTLNHKGYNILNTELLYHPEKGRFNYSISGKNLLDVSSIVNNNVSNVGLSSSSASLLGRYVMLCVSMSIEKNKGN